MNCSEIVISGATATLQCMCSHTVFDQKEWKVQTHFDCMNKCENVVYLLYPNSNVLPLGERYAS